MSFQWTNWGFDKVVNLPNYENTWEDDEIITNRFFNLTLRTRWLSLGQVVMDPSPLLIIKWEEKVLTQWEMGLLEKPVKAKSSEEAMTTCDSMGAKKSEWGGHRTLVSYISLEWVLGSTKVWDFCGREPGLWNARIILGFYIVAVKFALFIFILCISFPSLVWIEGSSIFSNISIYLLFWRLC